MFIEKEQLYSAICIALLIIMLYGFVSMEVAKELRRINNKLKFIEGYLYNMHHNAKEIKNDDAES